ncbi:MAG: hypothetical protein Q9220_005887 [cf. Caloplaca sp. 1 TL-2023]
MSTTLSQAETWRLAITSTVCLAVLANIFHGDGEPLIASLAFSGLAFCVAYSLIRWLGQVFLDAGLKGRDMSKSRKPELPETMGAICAVIYLLALIAFIPFPFYKDIIAATSRGADKDTTRDHQQLARGRFLHRFPHNKLASYLSALLSLQSVVILGIADDLFDIRWRHKLFIPAVAAIPMLAVYFVDYGVTSVVVPVQLESYFGTLIDLGWIYYAYMASVAIFCPNSINILAGINGIEVAQSLVIAVLLLLNDALSLYTAPSSPTPHPATDPHLFSIYLLLPFIGVSMALLLHNWYPAKVFVGDTYCYFAGMVFAIVGILGHFSKTLLLTFVPQIINFIYSAPQLFRVVPCPRHRMPHFNARTGLLEPSVTQWEQPPNKLVARLLMALADLPVPLLAVTQDKNGIIVQSTNFTLLNLWLVWFGPQREDRLAIGIVMAQIMLLSVIQGYIALSSKDIYCYCLSSPAVHGIMPSADRKPRTLYDKVFQDHVIDERYDGTILLYIDRHLVHEVTSPQAFEGLRNTHRKVRRPDCTLATTDHNVPTTPRKNFKDVGQFIEEADSRTQCLTLEENVKAFGLTYFGLGDKRQGIVHIIGPEQGFTLPGTTVVCGDSHTSTHGAFGALAFGIGTSEVEHVLATQTLITKRSKNMKIQVDGALPPGVSSKDIILHAIGVIGTAGGTGAVIEYCGSAIRGLSMEARMSICNMSIEAGARAGMIAPDDTTFRYLQGRPLAPKVESPEWKKAVKYWTSLKSDDGAQYDEEVFINAKDISPTVSWGTSPQDVVAVTGVVPDPADCDTAAKRESARRALEYMDLTPGTRMEDIVLDKVFIGSCTNARIEDLRAASRIVEGKRIAPGIKRAMVVPGSGLVKKQAEEEGLDGIFREAGFEWREAGCSMCLGMNPDILAPKERCASTSNRNFEGRQGAGGRTHLMSPIMAAAAAIVGKLTDVRKIANQNATPVKASPKLDITPEVSDIDTDDDFERIMDLPEPSQVQDETNTASSSGGQPKFTVLKGIAAPMERSNVDTDAIIPKQFLKTIKRTGLGSALFHSLRYDDKGNDNADFVLNKEPYRRAKILVVTGPNFGCGSSREHAPWALLDFGITCIIAPSYADIFFNNTFKNGMLPIAIPDQALLEGIAEEARAGHEIEVDLPRQQINNASGQKLAAFEVEEFRKHCLVNGLDDIGLTMQMEEKIRKFEERRTLDTPWLDGSGYLKRAPRDGPFQVEAAPVPKTNRGEPIGEPLEW